MARVINSSEYWEDRIRKAAERQLERSQAQTEKALSQFYYQQSKELHSQLLEVFNKMVSDAEDGKIYTNDLYKMNNYTELIKYFNECAKALGGKQVEITEQELIKTYEYARSAVEAFVPKDMLLKPAFIVPQQVDAKQLIHNVWCLDGKEWTQRVGASKQQLVKEMIKCMSDFTARGVTPFDLAQELTKKLDMDLAGAYRLARTEAAHVSVSSQVNKYKEMGLTNCRFLATDACPQCMDLDGQLFTLDEIETIIPRHPNCTCSFLLEV